MDVERKTEDDIPDEFLCPITGEIMKHPLLSIHGFNFERNAICAWLQRHSTCPMSRNELTISKLIRNLALQHRIEAWCQAYDMMHLLHSNDNDGEDDDDTCTYFTRNVGFILSVKQMREIQQLHHARRRRSRTTAATATSHRLSHRFRRIRRGRRSSVVGSS